MQRSNVLRARIESTLELIACRDAQFQYQAQTPGLDVSTELFLQWEDWYRPDSQQFAAMFDHHEASTLRAFHAIFISVRNEMLLDLPPLARFVETAVWRRYSDAARVTLGQLRAVAQAA